MANNRMAGSQAFQEELDKARGGTAQVSHKHQVSTPASDATLSGAYAPDNSTEATINRMSQYSTHNDSVQGKYAERASNIASKARKDAKENAYVNPEALDKRIGMRSQMHRDQSTIQGSKIFGDLFGMEGPDWNTADKAKPVEKPDFEEMYDKYTDFD